MLVLVSAMAALCGYISKQAAANKKKTFEGLGIPSNR
jgi:hypothetical protein